MYSRKESFLMYHDWSGVFEKLEPKQAKQLLLAMFAESKGEEPPEMDKDVEMAFILVSEVIRKDREKYLNRCKVNAKTANETWKKRKEAEEDE